MTYLIVVLTAVQLQHSNFSTQQKDIQFMSYVLIYTSIQSVKRYFFDRFLTESFLSFLHGTVNLTSVVMRTYIVCRHHLEFSQFLVQAKDFTSVYCLLS